eukprot:3616351-Rhodomonas_salina.1
MGKSSSVPNAGKHQIFKRENKVKLGSFPFGREREVKPVLWKPGVALHQDRWRQSQNSLFESLVGTRLNTSRQELIMTRKGFPWKRSGVAVRISGWFRVTHEDSSCYDGRLATVHREVLDDKQLELLFLLISLMNFV